MQSRFTELSEKLSLDALAVDLECFFAYLDSDSESQHHPPQRIAQHLNKREQGTSTHRAGSLCFKWHMAEFSIKDNRSCEMSLRTEQGGQGC